jgi:DNA-binding NarL/FixJ family response regulator
MKPISIGIVEDLKDVREGMVTVLSLDERFEMLCSFDNAEKAISELPAWQPDIVIVDINLPGMNGINFIKKIKNVCSHTQFIMFTVYENDEHIFEALTAGASGYLLKNTPIKKIVDSLIELNEGGAPMSMQIARRVIDKMRDDDSAGLIEALTLRENEILKCLSKGWMYKEIAHMLNIGMGTVRQHTHSIYKKLHVQNRTEALNKMNRK